MCIWYLMNWTYLTITYCVCVPFMSVFILFHVHIHWKKKILNTELNLIQQTYKWNQRNWCKSTKIWKILTQYTNVLQNIVNREIHIHTHTLDYYRCIGVCMNACTHVCTYVFNCVFICIECFWPVFDSCVCSILFSSTVLLCSG